MSIDDAIQAHAQWKFKLRHALYSGEALDPETIAVDNRCALGIWLHGDAKAKYGKTSAFAKCLTDHAEFHRQAGKIAAAINEKKKEEAERMLAQNSAFALVSKRISVTLIELKHEMPA